MINDNNIINDNKKYYFIYKTTLVLTGHYYIGQHSTNNINDKYLGFGHKLHEYIKIYGRENFKREILEYAKDRLELDKLERKYVTKELIESDSLCLNLKSGGDSGQWISQEALNKTHKIWLNKTPEERALIRQRIKENHADCSGEKNSFYGKKHTDETKQKISNSRKGKCVGKENPFYGKTHTEETIKKIKEANAKYIAQYGSPRLGQRNTEESKKNSAISQFKQQYWETFIEDLEIDIDYYFSMRQNPKLKNEYLDSKKINYLQKVLFDYNIIKFLKV